MDKIIRWLSGIKTYILMAGGILTAIGMCLNGDITVIQMLVAIWAALTGSAMRAGISKTKK